MVAAVLVPQLTTLKAGGATDVTYNNALSLLMNEVLPNGVLGVAIAGLLAAFMAGMAANVSSFNTVFTYDIWQDWIRPGRRGRLLPQGRPRGHRRSVACSRSAPRSSPAASRT